MHKLIMNHIDPNNIHTDSQHGFRSKRSCESQLITTFHNITRLLDWRDIRQVDAMVFDFAKAFDKVQHKRLTLKQIPRYIKTYSSLDRCISHQPDSTRSSRWIFIRHCSCFFMSPTRHRTGSPSFPLPLSKPNSSTRLFADDSWLFRAVKISDDCRLLQKDLDALQRWERTWQIHFRPDKCKLLRFTRAHNAIHHTYTLHGSNLESVHTHK